MASTGQHFLYQANRQASAFGTAQILLFIFNKILQIKKKVGPKKFQTALVVQGIRTLSRHFLVWVQLYGFRDMDPSKKSWI